MRNVRVAQLALVPCFALITGGMALVAEAKDGGNLNAHLRGAYAFTTARTCTVSPVPFGPAPFFALPPIVPPGTSVFRQSASDAGIVTFNGDGTATATGRSRTVNISTSAGSFVSVSEITSDIDYTVNPDGTVDTETTTSFATVFPVAGTTGTATGQTGRLQIAEGKKMLVSAPTGDPTVETLVFTPLVGLPFTQYRICERSTTETKLPGH